MSATHNGTCQVCGRQQALPNGMLAQHGYTVEHGFFEGVCPGSKYKPLEQDRKLADKVASDLLIQHRNELRNAAAVARGELLPVQAKSGRSVRDEKRGRGWRDEYVPYAEAPEYQQQYAVTALLTKHQQRAELAKSTSLSITETANRVHGKPLTPRNTESGTQLSVAVGSKVKIDGRVFAVVAIEHRVASGCGPHLNGNYMPHAILESESGKRYARPTRLIRRSSVIA